MQRKPCAVFWPTLYIIFDDNNTAAIYIIIIIIIITGHRNNIPLDLQSQVNHLALEALKAQVGQ